MKAVKKTLCLLLIAALLLPLAPAARADGGQPGADFAAGGLGGAMERYLAEKGLSEKNILIGWRDLESGEEWYFGADLFMEGASTYKLPLCMRWADWVADGSRTKDERVGAYTVDAAVREALIRSNNAAADALRYAISSDQRTYRTEIAANCGMVLDELPSGYYTANQFSPRYLIGTLRTLWNEREKYDWILDYMKQAQPDSYFSKYRGEYEVAHKTGNALGYIADSGIVFAEKPFSLTVLSFSIQRPEETLGELARIAMDYAEYLAARETPSPASEPTPDPAPEPTPARADKSEQTALPAAGADGVREIADANGLRAVALAPADSYRLTADIDLAGIDWTPFPFSGTLDGAGHTLYNLTLRAPGAESAEVRDGNNKPYEARFAALFSVVRGATIRDLSLRGVSAELESEDNCFVAALAGYAYDLTAENVSVEGRLHLLAHGKIVGVGGMIGFGSGWFSDCRSDVELVFEDRNESLHCEMFLGGLAASGKFTAERCSVDIRGYASVNGFVHTGGIVGMYCGYGLVRERMMRVTDCTVAGFIRFFEHNFTRRAYCRGFAGEQVDLVINERNDISGFKRDERFRYDVILLPEECAAPDYAETVTEPDCAHWGYTEHVCRGCGYSWIDRYTPPRHSPGEPETVKEPGFRQEGEAVVRCTVCGAELSRETLAARNDPGTVVLDAETLSLRRGETRALTARFLPEGADSRPLVWSSDDETVASVSADGTVSARGRGACVIRCESEDGALTARCRVTVRGGFLDWLRGLFR